MKIKPVIILALSAAVVAGCATLPPKELSSARTAYQVASQGPAGTLAPAELHQAREALVLAETSFKSEPDSFRTKNLAYVAQRKSELAGVLGGIAADKASKNSANAEYAEKQGELVKQGKQALSDSEKNAQQTLSASKAEGQLALNASEQKTADALAELAKLAAVKEEARGLVVTLSGSVLFKSGDSILLPTAQLKLDQVADALMAVTARNLVVEGHTDSQGSQVYNQGLSQRRAEAVRNYLVHKGYPAERIQARGMGKGTPIADNGSSEGRANNRRVEIVIEKEMVSSR